MALTQSLHQRGILEVTHVKQSGPRTMDLARACNTPQTTPLSLSSTHNERWIQYIIYLDVYLQMFYFKIFSNVFAKLDMMHYTIMAFLEYLRN